ncbi:hypothetical protein HanIR_Chr02g0060081 [Helianthus annuus]|nr:hypothetical protein HanIR_Chr10g0467331 [Helianthus annuus]KAJ0614230.1 hypothetical protein HanIR_Chr02g0060081 [Helianthus annuus]
MIIITVRCQNIILNFRRRSKPTHKRGNPMVKSNPSRHATPPRQPLATRERDHFPAINRRVWDMKFCVKTTNKFVLHFEISSIYYQPHT